ncbi:MAG: HYExAFE family protein [Phycisphaerales bacterium]
MPPTADPALALIDSDGVRRTPRPVSGRASRLECWATQEDVRSLRAWQTLFGPGFRAALVFVYWCDAQGPAEERMQPPDGLFDQVFLLDGRWYAVRGVLLDDYEPAMAVRSVRWGTVDLPPARFERLSEGFGRAWLGDVGGRRGMTGAGEPAQLAAGR